MSDFWKYRLENYFTHQRVNWVDNPLDVGFIRLSKTKWVCIRLVFGQFLVFF